MNRRFSNVKITPMDITFGSLNLLSDMVQHANDLISNTLNDVNSVPQSMQQLDNMIDADIDQDNNASNEVLSEENPIEREILIKLYHSMGGEQWKKKTHWLSSHHIGKWYEVKVDKHGRIYRLGLSNNNLTSSLSSDIEKLTSLQILDISKNNIIGELPFAIGNLIELRTFCVDGNQISSKIPDSFGNLIHLSKLYLANNKLYDIIPVSIGNMTCLTELILSNNNLTGIIPSTIGNLHQLQKLYLNNNQLTGNLPSSILQISTLTDMNVSHNQLSDIISDDWTHMVSLQTLSLSNNQFIGNLPSSLLQLPHLKELHAKHNKLSGSISLSTISSSYHPLEELDLSYNQFTGNLLYFNYHYPNLKLLNVSNNHLHCHDIDDCIYHLKNLTLLDISYNNISGHLPSKFFHHASQLITLSCHHNHIYGIIPSSISKLHHIESIDISYNNIHGEIPDSIDILQHLHILNVSHNKMSGYIPETMFELPNLKDFDISYNNYPIDDMHEYLNSNRFSNSEKIMLARELTCHQPELNSLEAVIRIARILLSSSTSSSSSVPVSPCHDTKKNHDDDKTSSDLKAFMMLVLNHEQLVMQAISNSNNNKHESSILSSSSSKKVSSKKSIKLLSTSSSNIQKIKWCANPGYIIKLIKEPFYEIFSSLIKVDSQSLLGPLILLKMYGVVVYAQINDPSSEKEFVDYEASLADALRSILSLSSLDDRNLMYQLLLPGRSLTKSTLLTDTKDGSGIFELLSEDSVIGICLDRNLKPIFSSPNIAMIISEIFSTPSRTRTAPDTSKLPSSLQDDYSYQSKIQQSLTHLAKAFQNARYCPIIMFYFNCLTKVLTLSLSTAVLFRPSYSIIATKSIYIEWMLVTMVTATVLYEYGQFHEAKYIFHEYSETVWNKMDLITCATLSYWVIGFYAGIIEHEPSVTLALAISAIPQSLSLLQYLCINKAFGQLVIMIFAMIQNIVDFMLVFMFCIFGFGIYFYGIYGQLPGSIYGTPYKTFMSLYGAALGNYDLDSFDDTYYAIVGSLILIIYVTFTAILLLNLLIARMSSAHELIVSRSQEEWSFIQASLLTEYAVMKERNPLCVLPAPFNIITILTYVYKLVVKYIHIPYITSSVQTRPSASVYMISSPRAQPASSYHMIKIDLVSTIANMLLRLIFAFPIMLFSLLSILINYKLAIELDGFEYEISSDNHHIKIHPVYQCHDYLGFFGGNGRYHGYINIDTIHGDPVNFKNADKLMQHVIQYIIKHRNHHDHDDKNKKNISLSSSIGYIMKDDMKEEYISSRPFSETLKDEDEIHDTYQNKNPIRSFFRPAFCVPIVIWEYFHCFYSDTVSYDSNSEIVHDHQVPTSFPTTNDMIHDDVKNIVAHSMDDHHNDANVLHIYEEDDVIDLLRLLNMRSETVDRIEMVKQHVKCLQGDIDDVKMKLVDMKLNMDNTSKAQIESITEIFDKNMEEIRYMIHK